MYKRFFGIERPPFKITPDTSAFFAGAQRGAVLESLVETVEHGDGIIKVVGEVGSGKTMLCRMLESRLPESVEVIYIANPSLSPDNILQVIAFEAELIDDPSIARFEAMNRIQHYLIRRHRQGATVAIFVEEAQCMPSATLEEIRLLSNLETGEKKLLQIVLFGQPELDENLRNKAIRQLKDRITHQFYLQALSDEEVEEYCNYRLWVAGYRGDEVLFGREVAAEIRRYASGHLRRVNILADKTLLAAYADGDKVLATRHVRAAADDCELRAPKRKIQWGVIGTSVAAGIAAGGITFGIVSATAPSRGDLAPAEVVTNRVVDPEIPERTEPKVLPETERLPVASVEIDRIEPESPSEPTAQLVREVDIELPARPEDATFGSSRFESEGLEDLEAAEVAPSVEVEPFAPAEQESDSRQRLVNLVQRTVVQGLADRSVEQVDVLLPSAQDAPLNVLADENAVLPSADDAPVLPPLEGALASRAPTSDEEPAIGVKRPIQSQQIVDPLQMRQNIERWQAVSGKWLEASTRLPYSIQLLTVRSPKSQFARFFARFTQRTRSRKATCLSHDIERPG